MQITFDTTTITDDEVRGIFALLDTVRPEALAVGEVTRPVEVKIPTFTSEEGNFSIDPNTCTITVSNGQVPRGPQPNAPEATLTITDSTGLVWDERIHASSKALNADGTWRTKRGVDKALVAEVEAELRATSPESIAAEDAEKYASHETLSPEAPTPPAPPAPEAPLVPAPTPTAPSPEPAESVPTLPAGVSPFVALMKRVTTAQGAGKLTQPRVKELLESLDKKSIMDLRTDEDALASFAVLLDGEGV